MVQELSLLWGINSLVGDKLDFTCLYFPCDRALDIACRNISLLLAGNTPENNFIEIEINTEILKKQSQRSWKTEVQRQWLETLRNKETKQRHQKINRREGRKCMGSFFFLFVIRNVRERQHQEGGAEKIERGLQKYTRQKIKGRQMERRQIWKNDWCWERIYTRNEK